MAVLYLFENALLQRVLAVEMYTFYEHLSKSEVDFNILRVLETDALNCSSISRPFTWKFLKDFT
jgi:hypothetical protein